SNDPTPITRLRVRVTGIEILNPLKAVTPALPARQRCSVTTSQDCSVAPCPGGETCLTLGGPTPGWQVWFEVNGHWQQLPGLSGVQTPGTIPQNLIYTVGMPAGGTLHLHASGKSLACLEAQLYGQSIARDLTLYGLTDGATCLTDASKDIGRFDISLSGPDFGSGGSSMAYVTPSVGGDELRDGPAKVDVLSRGSPPAVGDHLSVTGTVKVFHEGDPGEAESRTFPPFILESSRAPAP